MADPQITPEQEHIAFLEEMASVLERSSPSVVTIHITLKALLKELETEARRKINAN